MPHCSNFPLSSRWSATAKAQLVAALLWIRVLIRSGWSMSTLGPLELPVLRHGVLGLTTHQTRPTRTPPADRTRPGLGTPPPNLNVARPSGSAPWGPSSQPRPSSCRTTSTWPCASACHMGVAPFPTARPAPRPAARRAARSRLARGRPVLPGEAQSCHRGPRCCRRPPPPRRHPAACPAAAVVTSCFQAGSLIAGWPRATCGAAQLAAAARQAAQF